MGRPPDAGSVTARSTYVSRSPYADASVSQAKTTTHTNVIYYLVIAFVLAVVFMYIRARGSYGGTPVKTGPVLTLLPPAPPEQSTIDNLTQAINALAGQVHNHSPNPSGGVSTPTASGA